MTEGIKVNPIEGSYNLSVPEDIDEDNDSNNSDDDTYTAEIMCQNCRRKFYINAILKGTSVAEYIFSTGNKCKFCECSIIREKEE